MKSASVEKITVTEIVETCGVTRQTFYRNFKDKYDLINWYFDKILLESFEHMGEGKTVYEGLVNKFHYIQQEKLFFKAAFKNDDQNCLRDHDFQLICAFYTEQLETRMACRLSRQLQFQLEMYCQGSIYMTVQWVLGYRKCSAEELAHALASAMPEERRLYFINTGWFDAGKCYIHKHFCYKKTFQAKQLCLKGFLFTYDNIRIIKHTFYDFTAAITSVCGKDS